MRNSASDLRKGCVPVCTGAPSIQRPVTADMLLRLARTYKIDLSSLAGDGGADHAARMQAVLREPMFADIDMPPLEISDIAVGYPGLAEAFLRLYTLPATSNELPANIRLNPVW